MFYRAPLPVSLYENEQPENITGEHFLHFPLHNILKYTVQNKLKDFVKNWKYVYHQFLQLDSVVLVFVDADPSVYANISTESLKDGTFPVLVGHLLSCVNVKDNIRFKLLFRRTDEDDYENAEFLGQVEQEEEDGERHEQSFKYIQKCVLWFCFL